MAEVQPLIIKWLLQDKYHCRINFFIMLKKVGFICLIINEDLYIFLPHIRHPEFEQGFH